MSIQSENTDRNKTKIVSLFWTGGFDSTYRLIDLLLKGYTVETIYLTKNIDGRRSSQRERETMGKLRLSITEILPEVAENLLETVEVSDVIIPETISKFVKDVGFSGQPKATEWAVKMGYAHYVGQPINLGKQYAFLAILSMIHPRPIEVCVIKGDRAEKFFKDKVLGEGIHKRIDPSYFSDPKYEFLVIFRNFRLPVINMSKADMYRDARQRGFLDLLNQTWTCWKPVKGSNAPCGKCPTCKHRKKELREVEFLEGNSEN